MARNLTTGLQRGLRRSIAGGLGASDLFSVASLDLRFAQQKTLDPRITFTRASSGTYVGSDGLIKTATTNEARFDHNPTTGESLGLLVEEQKTNLVLQSNGFNTTWTNGNSSETAAAGTAPDGTNTAWELKDSSDASPTAHTLVQSVSFTAGTTYTLSCWMKAGTLLEGGMALPGSAFGALLLNRINLSTGAVASTSVNSTTVVTAFSNGWYRIALTATATVTATGQIQLRPMNGGISYTGTGTGTILIWGAQVEAGSFSTSYIPTTTATVTRSADVASITGANFSSWYNQSQGTVFAEYRTPASGTRGVADFNDNTANERIALFTNGTDPKLLVVDGGVTQVDVNGGTISAGVMTKSAAAYALNDFAFVHAAGTAVTDISGTIPTVDRLLISADQAGNYQNGRVKRLTYFPIRLPNATLQQITR